MRHLIAILVTLNTMTIYSQTDSKNYTKAAFPKEAFSVSQMEALVGNSETDDSFILQSAVSNETFTATESITLKNGFHATGSVSIRIVGQSEDVLQNITYYDGLGRQVQSIAKAQSPDGYDIIQFTSYDQFGRVAKNYLPYASMQNSGNLVANPITPQSGYYQTNYGDTYGYGETIFDDSPLNRVIESSSPGYDWRIISGSDSDHTTKMEYGTNAANSGVFKFIIDDSGSNPVITRYLFPVTELLKNVVKNQNWQPTDGLLNTVESYSDKNGRVIAKVGYEEVSGSAEKRITQNVYDAKGRLRYILPPKALIGLPKPLPGGTVYTIDEELVYQYQYDVYNRQIAQKVPGRDWEYLVYDQLDRPVLTQDANLAQDNQWLFTKYDAFGRPVYSGIYSSTSTREQLQQAVDTYINGNAGNEANAENRTTGSTTIGGIALNYTNDAFPISGITEVLSVNYYDDYSFTDSNKPTTPSSVQGQTVTTRTKGLQTANFSKTLGKSTWTRIYTYYDEKAREIKIYKKNHLGGYTTTDSKLDFRGKTELLVTKHKRNSSATELAINDRFTYDYAERAQGHFQQINGQAEERIAENEYDEMGMLIKKKVGGSSSAPNALQELTYSYNIKGQFKALNDVESIGSALFAFKINYSQAAEGSSAAPARYDGTISQTIWRSAYDNTKRGYAYAYDKLNRLSSSYYQYNNSLSGNSGTDFNTQLSYDAHGNISTLTRKGSGNVLDQLTYNYDSPGNQLLSVADTGSSLGFVDGNTGSDDYDYDGNGNMIKDLNKGISQIAYNHLDLVGTVSLPGGKSLTFSYDASGGKLEKKYLNGSTTITDDYLGGFQYQQGVLQFFPTPEGYVYKDGSTYKYMYIYTDHLGNNRVSYSDDNGNGTLESSELATNRVYYPYGGVHSGEYVGGLASGYDYTFQGKEYQDEDGLNWHDFGSRNYDASLGRWMVTDPQNQFASPYMALGNNPVTMVDPDGEFVFEAFAIGALINTMIQGLSNNINSTGDFFGSVFVGGLSGVAGAGTGQLVSTALGMSTTLSGSIFNGVLKGAAGGFSAGFISNAGNSWAAGEGFDEGLNSGLKSGGYGAITGGVLGGISGAINYSKQTAIFRQGNKELGVQSGDAVSATDDFLGKAQNAWYPDAPMNKVHKFTVENVTQEQQLLLDSKQAGAMTLYTKIGNKFSGNSNVYFNKNLAFTSAKRLFYAMGHEFIHVSQFASLAGQPVSLMSEKGFLNLMEFHAYSYETSVLGSSNYGAFTKDDIPQLMTQFPNYFKTLSYTNFPWTMKYKFIYPFK